MSVDPYGNPLRFRKPLSRRAALDEAVRRCTGQHERYAMSLMRKMAPMPSTMKNIREEFRRIMVLQAR